MELLGGLQHLGTPPLVTHLRDQMNSLRASRSRVRDQGQLGKRGQLRRSQFRSLSRLGSVQISRRLTSNSQKRNSVKAPAKSVKNQRRVEPAKSSLIKRRKRGSKRICLRSQPETSSESEIESSSESSSSLSEDQNKRKKQKRSKLLDIFNSSESDDDSSSVSDTDDDTFSLGIFSDSLSPQMSKSIKKRIWNREYMKLSKLYYGKDSSNVSINVKKSRSATLTSLRRAPQREITNILSWCRAFQLYASIYSKKYASEGSGMFKYMTIIQTLAHKGQNWKIYD